MTKSLLGISWCMPPMVFPRSIQVARSLSTLTEFGWTSAVLHADPVTLTRAEAADDPFLLERYCTGRIDLHAVNLSDHDPSLRRRLMGILRRPWGDQTALFRDRARYAALKMIERHRYDAFVTFGQPWVDHHVGLDVIARRSDIPWVAHFSDPWVDNPFDGSPEPERAEARRLEHAVVARADALVFVSDALRKLVMGKYPARYGDKAFVVPHCFDPTLGVVTSEPERSRRRMRLVYTGAFYGPRSPLPLINVLKRWNAEVNLGEILEVRLIGPGTSDWLSHIRQAGLDEVCVTMGNLRYPDAVAESAAADVLVLIDADLAGSVFLPSKLIDYIGLQRPILGLTPLDSTSAALLRRLECPVLSPDDGDGLLATLKDMHAHWRGGTLGISEAYRRIRFDFTPEQTTRAFAAVLDRALKDKYYGSPLAKPAASSPAAPASVPDAPASDKVSQRPVKVCLVSPYAYSLFNQRTSFLFGGSEVRGWLLARGLAAVPQFQVSVVVFDHGQDDDEVFDNCTLHKWPPSPPPPGSTRWENYRWLLTRRIIPAIVNKLTRSKKRYSAFDAIYDRIDADVYWVLGVTNLAGEVCAYTRQNGKKFLLMAGSDMNFSDMYYAGSQEIDSYGNVGHLCHFAITHADCIVTQTNHQADLCHENFGRQVAAVISNPMDHRESMVDPDARRRYVLWIGKSDRTKQPDKLIHLARQFPDTPFLMVMNRSSESLHQRIIDSKPDNVKIIERLSYSETDRLFANALVLVSTSKFEGFPNTFLQAGKYGVPIASLVVDPDGFVEREGCGVVASNDLDQLAEGLGRLIADPQYRADCGAGAARYVVTHHNLDDKVGQFAAEVTRMMSREVGS